MRSATRNKTGRDDNYRAFIREQWCVACFHLGRKQRSEFCHQRDGSGVVGRGLSQKEDDKFGIPLCPDHHSLQHRIGADEFFKCLYMDLGKTQKYFQGRYKMAQTLNDATPSGIEALRRGTLPKIFRIAHLESKK